MSWTTRMQSMRPSLYALSILALAITVMWGGTQFSTTQSVVEAASGVSDAPAATFPGTGTGPIPDNNPAGINVTYNVSGITGAPSAVSVDMNLTHSWVGDLDIVLRAPGGSPSHVIFANTGALTATAAGDSSNLLGLYNFTDTATGTNWWAAAAAVGDTVPVPAGDYRTTEAGPQPAANFSPVTSLNAAFAGVANANGTWTLNVSDNAGLDTGSINASNLTITGSGPPAPPAETFDFIGDGLADYTVVLFPTPPATGTVRWRTAQNDNPTTATSPISEIQWGTTASDSVPAVGNYLGTPRSDFTVYRNNAGAPANSYLSLENQGNAVGMTKYQQWGDATADVIGAEGDYNGDSVMDYTVVRNQSGTFQWYILNSGSNTLTSFAFGNGNPETGDIPLAGADYVGDNRHDPTVIRIGAGNAITFYVGNTSGAIQKSRNWGSFDTDYVVPGGDYDGDGKADFAVWRGFGSGANGAWYILSSTDAATSVVFGIAGNSGTRDLALRGGDYDGDGKDDIAVYRPSTTSFIVRRSSDLATTVQSVGGNASDSALPLAGFGVN